MGDIKRLRKKFKKPGHPWQKARIEEEKKLMLDHGFKNKREIWKLSTTLKTFSNQAKKLIAATGKNTEKEKSQLMQKLNSLGLVKEGAKLDDVLALTFNDILGRRLQTIIHKKGFSRSPKQARQFITHEHVKIGAKTVSSPSYLVSILEENSIVIDNVSSLSNVEHPERVAIVKKQKATIAREHNDYRRRDNKRHRKYEKK